MNDGLDVIEPSGSVVAVGGERLEIKPLVIGVLPQLVRTARPVVDAVLNLDDAPGGDGLLVLVMDLIEGHGEQLLDAVALCTGRDKEWVRELDLADFTTLTQTVFEVNRDFFVQRLAPLLAARAKRAGTGAGPTASSS